MLDTWLPWFLIRSEFVFSVGGGEELHPNYSEDVHDDDEDEGEVAHRPEGFDHNSEEHAHRRPRLGQLEHAQQT